MADEIGQFQASSLRKNGFMMMKSRPCKIVEMSTSKTGKHGHAKISFVGIDIMTGKKYEAMHPSTHNVHVPVVHTKELQVIDVDDGHMQCMQDDNSMMDVDIMCDDLTDCKHPEYIGQTCAEKVTNLCKHCDESNETIFAHCIFSIGEIRVKELRVKQD
ncbi:hypothetical protein A3Q56_00998 [Intoshia linei]|uniref:Eukaryotic translation initiation factor 5A n=1 Tax=Intoshia linei TaxID=1819745 RepID=A0A177BC35_9BILA|nr:hypothetical protein A3Q56_00998 [Intoshia linei]